MNDGFLCEHCGGPHQTARHNWEVLTADCERLKAENQRLHETAVELRDALDETTGCLEMGATIVTMRQLSRWSGVRANIEFNDGLLEKTKGLATLKKGVTE